MSNVTDIWLFVQTSTATNSNSTASLQLNVNFQGLSYLPPPPSPLKLPTASQQTSSNDINQLGGSAQFHWSQQSWPGSVFTLANIYDFTLQIVGDSDDSDNAWIPASIWVILKTDVGEYVPGPQCPKWDGSCFSTQSSDCGGKAKPYYALPWSQSEPIIEFTSGAIDEGQLEPSESATYTFDVVNLTDTMFFDNIVIGIADNQQRFPENGVTIDVPIGPSGLPEITVAQTLSPGGRLPVTFSISTSNATPMSYGFLLVLLSWEIIGVSTGPSRFFIDDGQEFSVVPD